MAAAPSRVRVYPKTEIIALLRSEPALAEAFMARLAHQLQELRTRMELRNIRSARERLLQYLRLRAGRDESLVHRSLTASPWWTRIGCMVSGTLPCEILTSETRSAAGTPALPAPITASTNSTNADLLAPRRHTEPCPRRLSAGAGLDISDAIEHRKAE